MKPPKEVAHEFLRASIEPGSCLALAPDCASFPDTACFPGGLCEKLQALIAAERAPLMEVLAFIVDQGGTMLKYEVDPRKLPPGLAKQEDRDWADIPDWNERI